MVPIVPKFQGIIWKIFSQGFQNRSSFLIHVVLKISKFSPKLSTYRWDTLYKQFFQINYDFYILLLHFEVETLNNWDSSSLFWTNWVVNHNVSNLSHGSSWSEPRGGVTHVHDAHYFLITCASLRRTLLHIHSMLSCIWTKIQIPE